MKPFRLFLVLVIWSIFAPVTPAHAAEPGDTYSTAVNGPPVYITSGVAGDSVVAGTYPVPEAAGRTCDVSITATNGPSTHPDSMFVVSSTNSVTLNDVERSSGITTTASGLVVNGTITVTAVAGPDGKFSASHAISLTCGPIPHTPAPVTTGTLECIYDVEHGQQYLLNVWVEGNFVSVTPSEGVFDTPSIEVITTWSDGPYGEQYSTLTIQADVTNCAPQVTTPPTTAPPATTAPPTTAVPEETTTAPTVTETTVSTTEPPVTSTTISTTAPPTTTPPVYEKPTLPNTGSETLYIALGGILLMALGAFAIAAASKHSDANA